MPRPGNRSGYSKNNIDQGEGICVSHEATRWGSIASDSEEQSQRQHAITDPGSYHGNIAARELHWFDGNDWVTADADGHWQSLGAGSGAGEEAHPADWRPWDAAFDDSAAPFFRWFRGGKTNACFNEVDRHVLGGRGDTTALIFEGDRWDPRATTARAARYRRRRSVTATAAGDRAPRRRVAIAGTSRR
jgi:acyl-coenzyme A synthetase/AMP-(fatty) acid ligase